MYGFFILTFNHLTTISLIGSVSTVIIAITQACHSNTPLCGGATKGSCQEIQAKNSHLNNYTITLFIHTKTTKLVYGNLCFFLF